MMQSQRAGSVVLTLKIVVCASMVQNGQGSDEEDDLGAQDGPVSAVYQSHSGSIWETLEDLKPKVKSQLAEARHPETTASHNVQLLKQSLNDEPKVDAQDSEDSKKYFERDEKSVGHRHSRLEGHRQTLSQRTQQHSQTPGKIARRRPRNSGPPQGVAAKTGGAESFTYSLTQSSFLQLSRTVLSMQGACSNSRLSGRSGTSRRVSILELEQLASRVVSAMHVEVSNGDDHFCQEKKLISDMIARLEGGASADVSQKARAKRECEKYSFSINTKTAKFAQLERELVSKAAKTKFGFCEEQAAEMACVGCLACDCYGGRDRAHEALHCSR